MKQFDIIRAWTNEEYRNSLSSEELAQLPENPAGSIELNDTQLETIEGAQSGGMAGTAGCCPPTGGITCSQVCATEIITIVSYVSVTLI